MLPRRGAVILALKRGRMSTSCLMRPYPQGGALSALNRGSLPRQCPRSPTLPGSSHKNRTALANLLARAYSRGGGRPYDDVVKLCYNSAVDYGLVMIRPILD